MNQTAKNSKIWLALITLYIAWGSTYLAIHYLVLSSPPILASGMRNLVAGLLLLIFVFFQKKNTQLTSSQLLKLAIPGILMLSLGNGLLTIAAKWVPSGYMSLFPALVPAWIVLLQWFFGQKPTPITIAGLILGFVGLFLLINKSQLSIVGYEQYFNYGVLALLGATISWAAGVIYAVRNPVLVTVAYSSAIQMVIGGLFSLIISLILGEYHSFSVANIQPQGIWAFLWLLSVGSILGFMVFNWLSGQASPTLVSTYAYVNPIVALYLGWLVLDEPLNRNILLSTILIVSAVVLVTIGNSSKK
jgi:drug/metabolite transporter (DMT)-like permease